MAIYKPVKISVKIIFTPRQAQELNKGRILPLIEMVETGGSSLKDISRILTAEIRLILDNCRNRSSDFLEYLCGTVWMSFQQISEQGFDGGYTIVKERVYP